MQNVVRPFNSFLSQHVINRRIVQLTEQIRAICSYIASAASTTAVVVLVVIAGAFAENDMPRTKYSRKPKTEEFARECDVMMKSFERHTHLRIIKLERDAQADMKSFENFVDVMVSRLPPMIRQLTLREIFDLHDDNRKEDEENNEVSSSVKSSMQPPATAPKLRTANKRITKRATAASDDGYVTEGGTGSVDSTSRLARAQINTEATRRTRSSTRERTKLGEINQRTVTKPKRKDRSNNLVKIDNFKTPTIPKTVANVYNVVTPKVKPNTPLNVLRRPRQGEMVLSMQGSPLLVSAVVEEKTANVNVPLANGSMMSLLPQEGLRMSHIPQLDSETMHQLKTLKSHIEKVIALK